MGKVHFIVGIICVLIIILVGTLMELSSVKTGILFGILALVSAPILYKLIGKVPKHDDDIHYHERRKVRH